MDKLPKKIPTSAGVYFFLDQHKKPLYIGKASNLKNRLSSYFNGLKDARITTMLEKAAGLRWQVLNSEIEALIIESRMIKQHHPAFNILLRDDKQYFYVQFLKTRYAKVKLTHQPTQKAQDISGSEYIGPFTSGNALKVTLKILRKVFPYCTCTQEHTRPCLNYHLGKCLGFCCVKNSHPDKTQLRIYKSNIKALKDLLSGKRQAVIRGLEKKMLKDAKSSQFEEAIAIREKMAKLKKIFENATIIQNMEQGENGLSELKNIFNLSAIPARIEGYDISHMQGAHATGSMITYIDGQPSKNDYRKFKILISGQANDTAMLTEVLERRFKHPEWPFPDLILIDGGKAQLNSTLKSLDRLKLKIPVISLTKDEHHHGVYVLSSYDQGRRHFLVKELPPSVSRLISAVDNEAHRFAISYYRKLHRSRSNG